MCASELRHTREPSQVSPPDPNVLEDAEHPAGAHAGLTPEEYKDWVAQDHAAALAAKRIPAASDGRELLQAWQHGLVTFHERRGLGAADFFSMASKGFLTPCRKGSQVQGIAIASMPGHEPIKYNTVARICMQYSMDFDIDWEPDWGNAWFFIWLRNVVHSYTSGFRLVVLTMDKEERRVGRAQSAEIATLRLLRMQFLCLDIDRFTEQLLPFHAMLGGAEANWDSVKQLLHEPNVNLCQLLRMQDGLHGASA